jgi:hypothetical protein
MKLRFWRTRFLRDLDFGRRVVTKIRVICRTRRKSRHGTVATTRLFGEQSSLEVGDEAAASV